MRAAKHADGMNCHPRYIPVVTVGPGCTERREGGPHKDVVDVKTMVVMATRELLVSLRPPEFLNGFAKHGERWKHEHRPPLPVLWQSIYRQCLRLQDWRHKLGKMLVVDCSKHACPVLEFPTS